MDNLAALRHLIGTFEIRGWELDNIKNPQWGQGHTRDDWQVYIPSPMQLHWGKLSMEARIGAYLVAREQALIAPDLPRDW